MLNRVGSNYTASIWLFTIICPISVFNAVLKLHLIYKMVLGSLAVLSIFRGDNTANLICFSFNFVGCLFLCSDRFNSGSFLHSHYGMCGMTLLWNCSKTSCLVCGNTIWYVAPNISSQTKKKSWRLVHLASLVEMMQSLFLSTSFAKSCEMLQITTNPKCIFRHRTQESGMVSTDGKYQLAPSPTSWSRWSLTRETRH